MLHSSSLACCVCLFFLPLVFTYERTHKEVPKSVAATSSLSASLVRAQVGGNAGKLRML